MDTLEIKLELQRMIEAESDPSILEAIRELLQKQKIDPVLQEKMVSRALKAEEDFKAGRFYTREEVIQRTNKFVGK